MHKYFCQEAEMGLFTKLFGSYSDRELKRIMPIARAVEEREEEYGKLTDEQLRGKTDELKQRLAEGETLDDILPDAFATAREAAWRVLGMKPFPVQIIGGIVLLIVFAARAAKNSPVGKNS